MTFNYGRPGMTPGKQPTKAESYYKNGIRYIKSPRGDFIDINYYTGQPSYEKYIKKNPHKNFTSKNDVEGYLKWAKTNKVSLTDNPATTQPAVEEKKDKEGAYTSVDYEDTESYKDNQKMLIRSKEAVPKQLNVSGLSIQKKDPKRDTKGIEMRGSDRYEIDKKDANKLGIKYKDLKDAAKKGKDSYSVKNGNVMVDPRKAGNYKTGKAMRKLMDVGKKSSGGELEAYWQGLSNDNYIKKHYSGDSDLPKRPKAPKMPKLSLPGGIERTKVDKPSGLGGKIYEYKAKGNYDYEDKKYNPADSNVNLKVDKYKKQYKDSKKNLKTTISNTPKL